MRETWFVMEDGSFGDPREIKQGPDGKLAHKDGRKVAYAAHGPRSRGVNVEDERAKAKPVTAALTSHPPRRGYRTRESKPDDSAED